MKVLIVGLGSTGRLLVKTMSGQDYDITVIDKDKALVDEISATIILEDYMRSRK